MPNPPEQTMSYLHAEPVRSAGGSISTAIISPTPELSKYLNRQPTYHVVKSWVEFFEPIQRGEKTAELRRNDRNYQVGDILWLHEWDREKSSYTGRHYQVKIRHIISADTPCAESSDALSPDFVILSIGAIQSYPTVFNNIPLGPIGDGAVARG